jgi:TctA family transporter
MTYDLSGLITAVIFGFIGYFMEVYGYSRASMTVGLMLGKLAEQYLQLTRQAYGFSFIYRPFSIALIFCLVGIMFYPMLQKIFKK